MSAEEQFAEFVRTCASNDDLVREFDRLYGTNVGQRGTPLDLAIDDATGRQTSDAMVFLAFCADLWSRLPVEGAGEHG